MMISAGVPVPTSMISAGVPVPTSCWEEVRGFLYPHLSCVSGLLLSSKDSKKINDR